MKVAFITGITGQDGSYLSEFLLQRDYIVHGLIRRSSSNNLARLNELCQNKAFYNRLNLHEGDLTDSANLERLIAQILPDEIYNLGAMSHVQTSFEMPEYTADVNSLGTLRLLEAMKRFVPQAKFYQASTSELFGKVKETPQNEKTPFYPRSPYGVAKLYAYWTTIYYREAYKLFTCNGILFNHESPRRGENFVSRKITLAVARIKHRLQDKLFLGNLDAGRDWGFAGDFVEGMWLMLQQKEGADFVLATGKRFTVRQFVKAAFQEIGIEIVFDGKGVNEKGRDKVSGKVLVEVKEEFFRPLEVDSLQGDFTKARTKLGWSPKTTFQDLVKMMIKGDLANVQPKSEKKDLRTIQSLVNKTATIAPLPLRRRS